MTHRRTPPRHAQPGTGWEERRHAAPAVPRILSWGIVLAAMVAAVVMTTRAQVGLNRSPPGRSRAVSSSGPTLDQIPFNGRRAMEHLRTICQLGPRPSGSAAIEAQRRLLEEHFRGLGGAVTRQEFSVRHPLDGTPVAMANLIVQWHPDRRPRILLCAHYDTRPRPDRDATQPDGVFLGANDGASGVAVLMEMATHMPGLTGPYGVDFALFDGEEFVWDDDRDTYFLGSTWFARQHVARPPDYDYDWGVLLDMVGDADLEIRQDWQSMQWRDTRPLVLEIWNTARRLGVREFVFRRGPPIRDDHIPLHDIAHLSVCDVIDFDYPHWHTTRDVPEMCSAESLAKVGWVILEWVKAARPRED